MHLLIIILSAVSIAAILGTIEHYRNLQKIRRLAKLYRQISIQHILIGLILLSAFAINIGLFTKTLNLTTITAICLIVSFATITLTVTTYNGIFLKFVGSFIKNLKLISVLCGIPVLVTSLWINAAVDIEISSLTGLVSSEFPNAQKTNFTVVAALLISLLIFVALFVAYLFQTCIAFISMFRSFEYVNGLYGSLCIIFRLRRVKDNDMIPAITILFGLFISLAGLNVSIQKALGEKEIRFLVRDYLLKTSYLEASHYCKNLTGKDLKIAFLRSGRVSVAKSKDDGNIVFTVSSCDRAEVQNI